MLDVFFGGENENTATNKSTESHEANFVHFRLPDFSDYLESAQNGT